MFNKEIKCLNSHQKKKKSQTNKQKIPKSKNKRERGKKKNIQNKQTNKQGAAKPVLQTSRHEPPGSALPSGGSPALGGGVAGGIVGGTEAERRPRSHRAGGGGRAERRARPRAPARGSGPGRQQRDRTEVERCQGGNSRHPSGRQVRDPASRRGCAAGLPCAPSPSPALLAARTPRRHPARLRGSRSGAPILPADNPILSRLLRSPPRLPSRASGGVGVAIPPSLTSLNFFSLSPLPHP